MNQKISLKMWLSTFFGGIWQFIRNLFSWKNKSRIGKFVCICFGLLALSISIGIAYAIFEDIRRDNRYLHTQEVSNRILFARKYYSDKPGWITSRYDNKKLIDNVDWIAVPEKEDSLAIYCQKGKRGFFNRFTGREVIPAKYDAAWLFSNGIAAVAQDSKILFINEKGEQIINKTFPRDHRLNYAFYGDYCLMGNGQGSIGLIDKEGNWAVHPEYDEIIPAAHNYWMVSKNSGDNELWYVLTDQAKPIEMEGVKEIEVNPDLGVIYTMPNHLKMVIDYEGNRQEKFLCNDIQPIMYDTDKMDKQGELIKERATLYKYRMSDGYEGLCKANGDIVTEPLYWHIVAIDKDLYHCTYKHSYNGVIINSQGEISKQ